MNKGQSLIEILVALSIFIAGTVTIAVLVLDANISSRQGIERTQAIALAREGLEAARSLRDADFDNLIVGTHGIILSGTWMFSGSSDTQDQFTRRVVITDIDVDTKAVESSVNWQFTQPRQTSVTSTGYLTDWKQTHGDAGQSSVAISGAELRDDTAVCPSVTASTSNRLQGITIENTGTGDITIDKMQVDWSTSPLTTEVMINASTVWGGSGGVGSPSGNQPSGTELDIVDYTLGAGGGAEDVCIDFTASVAGTDFIVKFIMTDGSTQYSLVDF